MQLTQVVLLSCTILVAFAASTLPDEDSLATLGDTTETSTGASAEAATQDVSGSPPSLSDAEETRFIEVNYCNSTQEEIIRKSAAEAKRIMIKTLDILKVLLEQFDIDNVPPENSDDQLGYQFQTYFAFWEDVILLLDHSPSALPEAQETMEVLVESLQEVIPEMRETSARIEITCNTPWLLKAPQFPTRADRSFYLDLIGHWANTTGYYVHDFLPLLVYDNRTSISPQTADLMRFSIKFVQPHNVGMVDPENLFRGRLSAVIWDRPGLGPFPDVIALNATYLSSWKDPYKDMEGMHWVSSLDEINTQWRASSEHFGRRDNHRVPDDVYSLEDIVQKSLTGVFLNLFPQVHVLQVGGLLVYDEYVQSFRTTRRRVVLGTGRGSSNFAYLAMALYLDKWQWITNGNRIPRAIGD